MTDNVLLSVEEMSRADAAAIAGEIRRRWQPRPVVVLC